VLQFTLEGDSTVYLDDVFFKSQHLILGNPSDARIDINTPNNYLVEKPQYSLSYNDAIKGPNWVSWQLNQSWVSDLNRTEVEPDTPPSGYTNIFPRGFGSGFPNYPNGVQPVDGTFSPVGRDSYPWVPDQMLPEEWVKTQGIDYLRNNRIPNRRLDRGHLASLGNRNRTLKDAYSSFLTSNTLPQLQLVNRVGGAWFNLEKFVTDAATDSSNVEFYIIAGGAKYDLSRRGVQQEDLEYPEGHPFHGHPAPVPGAIQNFVARRQNPDTGEWEYDRDSNGRIRIDLRTQSNPEWIANPKLIGVPDYTWKIIIPLRPGQGSANINRDTQITSVIIPNADPRQFSGGQIPLPNGRVLTVDNPGDWTQYVVSVRDIEEITGYNFLSEIPQAIQDAIETRTNTEIILS
jgi:DNA/RNA endonuclease G (NUC1)